MLQKQISGYTFNSICTIIPVLDRDGKPILFMPQFEYNNVRNLPLNEYGKGPFCKFKIPSNINASGVYALLVNGSVKYIGQCDHLSPRWNAGYGNISPKNCFKGGQSTNCRLNNLILDAFKTNNQIDLYFHETLELNRVESDLIEKLAPEWNIKQSYGILPQKLRMLSNLERTNSSRNKYQALTDYLLASPREIEQLAYDKMEELLGFELPYSAYEYREWWANSGHKHAETWTSANWKVTVVNLGKLVTFEKE